MLRPLPKPLSTCAAGPAKILGRRGMSDLTWTEDFATVTWQRAGRTEVFTFTAQQRAAIKILIEAGGRALSKVWILERIGSNAERLRDVFKRKLGMHPAWRTLIQTPLEHRLGKDLFLVPRENPARPPGGPQGMSDSPSQGATTAPAIGGEMVSRLPDDTEGWLDGQMAGLCADLTVERNILGALLRWGAILERADKAMIRAAAGDLEADGLVSGLHYFVTMALREGQSLSWLDAQLGGLADAWAPEGSGRWRASACPAAFTPEGFLNDPELLHVSALLANWAEHGRADELEMAASFAGAPSHDDVERQVALIVEKLRSYKLLEGRVAARNLADALEARSANSAYGLDLFELQYSIFDEVWAL